MSSVAMSMRKPHISAFGLKVCAIAGMTACHIGILAEEYIPFWLYCLLVSWGGVAFPVMAFLVSEGYRHTSNCKRYALRLGLFALIAQIPYSIFFEPSVFHIAGASYRLPFEGNVLITLLVGLGLLVAHDRMKIRAAFWGLVVVVVGASVVLDWGVIGPIMILAAQLLDEGRPRQVLPAVLALAAGGIPALFGSVTGDLSCLPEFLYEAIGGTLACVMLAVYDGTRGKSLRLFFYLYYPLHIALIGIIVELCARFVVS